MKLFPKSWATLATLAGLLAPLLPQAQTLCGSAPFNSATEWCFNARRPVPIGLDVCEFRGVLTLYDPREARCESGLVVQKDRALCVGPDGRSAAYDPADQYCYQGQITQHNNKWCVSPNGSMFVLEPGRMDCNGVVRP